MSMITLDQPVIGPVIQGRVPVSLPFPNPDSNLSLLINASGVLYELEAPIVGSPIIEDDRIIARFVVDHHVYLNLNLIGQSVNPENKLKSGQFSLIYKVEEHRPRAHFVADTLMAVIGLAGRLDLKMFEPDTSINLTFDLPLLEISKMLHRRQTAYRLMAIEEMTGKQFFLPSAISEKEIDKIAFIYHAIFDRSFTWLGGTVESSMPATQENASLFAQLIQPFSQSHEITLSETVLGQPVDLGRATVNIEDAVIKNFDETQRQLEAGDGHQVTLEICSLSGQDKYEFTETPYSAGIFWEPKIQALIDLEPYLDATIAEHYHALAAATLAGLSEEEKKEMTTFPDLDDAFIVDADGE